MQAASGISEVDGRSISFFAIKVNAIILGESETRIRNGGRLGREIVLYQHLAR